MDILRMGIESIDSFDAKSYEYRIEFPGVVFDVESNVAHFVRHKSNLAWLFDVWIEQMALFDKKSIDSIEQTVIVDENGLRRVQRNIARRVNMWADATEV